MTNDNLVNDTRYDDAIKAARALGTESVKGEASKPNHAMALVRGIADDVLDTEAKIEAHFDAYMESRTKAIAKNPLLQGGSNNPNSEKAQRSKQKQIAELAKLPDIDAVDLLAEVNDRRAALIAGEAKVKPAYDSYVDIARAQLKQPKERLSGDMIDAVIKKKDAAEKDLIAKLIEQYKKAYKMAEVVSDDISMASAVPHLEAARDAIGEAISELGGDVPSMTKASRKEAEVMEFLMSKGFSKADAKLLVK